jgi:acyl carrier protein
VTLTSDTLEFEAFGVALLSELELAPITLYDETHLVDDLGFDSVLLFELLLVIEDWTGVMLPEALLPHLETVGDVYEVYRTRRAQR